MILVSTFGIEPRTVLSHLNSGQSQFGLTPSHPLHVMPPRITRNSHRPRASDRTMVASEATSLASRSLQLDSIVTRAEKHENENKPNLSREVKLQWAGSRETISTPFEAEFFLDIPFYRTH
jgi:hypothetical protein